MTNKLIAAIKDKVNRIRRTKPEVPWQLDEYQRAFHKLVLETLVEAGIDDTEINAFVDDSYNDAVNSAAAVLLPELKKRWPSRLRDDIKRETGFRRRTYARWKRGIDLLRMIVVISHEVAERFNELYRPSAVESEDYLFEALINLHARALRVSREIITLLESGYPDGALSRWRTLHELATIMTFLRDGDDALLAERFLLHKRVIAYKAQLQYREFQERANLDPITEDELDESRAVMEHVIDRFGPEMKGDYGWAAEKLNNERPTLFDIEKYVRLDHWRPRVKWACDDIHGSYRATGTTLGEAESVSPVLLAGASNSAFTEPAHMLSISLHTANVALLSTAPTIDLLAILRVLQSLADEVGREFLDIELKTTRQ